MQFLLLIHVQESGWDTLTPEQQGDAMQEYGKFHQDIQEKRQLISGNRLTPSARGTTVRVREGKRLVTDGPFAESKEQIGGYYLIEAKDLDEAIAIAAKCPGSHHGSVEVRPIMTMGQARPA
jgi:hypothetical protein